MLAGGFLRVDFEGDSQLLIPSPCRIQAPLTRPGHRVFYTDLGSLYRTGQRSQRRK
jgi:hypothetical protein